MRGYRSPGPLLSWDNEANRGLRKGRARGCSDLGVAGVFELCKSGYPIKHRTPNAIGISDKKRIIFQHKYVSRYFMEHT